VSRAGVKLSMNRSVLASLGVFIRWR
jgi:hypothetical protein